MIIRRLLTLTIFVTLTQSSIASRPIIKLDLHQNLTQQLQVSNNITNLVSKTPFHVVMELDASSTENPNLLDLEGKRLTFKPQGNRYVINSSDSDYDPDKGPVLSSGGYDLAFPFPFAGQSWSRISINQLGNVTFGDTDEELVAPNRFAQLNQLGASFATTLPVISAMFKLRMTGSRYVTEATDKVTVTWVLNEPVGGIMDFKQSSKPTEFQMVLHKDGTIEFDYLSIDVEDAVVGVFPVSDDIELGSLIAEFSDPDLPAEADYLNIDNVTIREVLNKGVQIVFTLNGEVPAEGSSAVVDNLYRVFVDLDEPYGTGVHFNDYDYAYDIRGEEDLSYSLSGSGAFGGVKVEGNTLSINVAIPGLRPGGKVAIFFDAFNPSDSGAGFDQVDSKTFTIPPSWVEIDLTDYDARSEFTPYEIFHYRSVPDTQQIRCDVIEQLGDEFDFFAFYSQSRLDQAEAGTPVYILENSISGIGLDIYESRRCSSRAQASLVNPIFIDSLQGTTAGSNGPNDGFNFAMSQLGHEFGHRWGARLKARAGGAEVTLNDSNVHWRAELHAPVAQPWQEALQASAMGGGYWRENEDGAYSRIADNYFVPASGFSYLDLYLMGLIPPGQVPNFFLLRDSVYLGIGHDGYQRWSGQPTEITIDDVIALNGARNPTSATSQKSFNAAFVYLVTENEAVKSEKLDQLDDLSAQFLVYWNQATDGLSAMARNIFQVDSDGDGIGDNSDAFPNDASETTDSDADGTGDNSDNCPELANTTQSDVDSDGQGDACDSDDDNDGLSDEADAFPLDPTEQVDTDGDGIGDNSDVYPEFDIVRGYQFLQTTSASANITSLHVLNTSDREQSFRALMYDGNGDRIGGTPLIGDPVPPMGRIVLTSEDIEGLFNTEPWKGPAMLEVRGESSFDLMSKLISPSGLVSNTNCVREDRVLNIEGFDSNNMSYIRLISTRNNNNVEVTGTLYDTNGDVVGNANSVLVSSLAPNQQVWVNRNDLANLVGAEWNGEALLEVNKVTGLKLLNLNYITDEETFFNFSCFEDSTSGGVYLQTTSTSQNVSATHLVNTSDVAQQLTGTLYGSDGAQVGSANQPLHSGTIPSKGRVIISSEDIESAFNISPWSGPAMLEVNGTESFELMTKLTSPSGLISNTNCVRQDQVHNIGGFDQTDITYVRLINISDTPITNIRGSLYDTSGNVVGETNPILIDELPAKAQVWRNRNQLSDLIGDTWNGTASLEIDNADSNLRLLNLNFINSETFFNFSCYETGQ